MRKTSFDHEPGLNDIRDSSFIEQDADNVLYIWRLTNTEYEAVLKIAKNRRMGMINKKIPLMKQGYYLVEIVKNEK